MAGDYLGRMREFKDFSELMPQSMPFVSSAPLLGQVGPTMHL